MEAVGIGVTVTVMELELAVVGLAHASLLVKVQVITSLFCNVVDEKVALFVPALLPLTFH